MTEVTTIDQLKTSAVAAPRQTPAPMSFFTADGFELMQRIAKAFMASDLVPQQYQGNLPNCLIALDMAQRIGANPLLVMQNLYVVHGTPGWSSKFLIATVNTCGRFSSMRYEWKGEPGTPEYGCRAWAVERDTGERLDGIWVTWAMVKAEGWSGKKGSKWLTMPDQMFVYRAAAFWQRVYAPDLAMGLQTAEEVRDVYDAGRGSDGTFEVTMQDLKGRVGSESQQIEPEATDAEFEEHGTDQAEDVNKETGEITPKKERKPRAKPEPKEEAQAEQEEEQAKAEDPAADVKPGRRQFGTIE